MHTVSARLSAERASGRLQVDEAQRGAATRLDALLEALASDRGAPRLRWPWMAAPPPPRGVYLWGGVGRGKTLLMDLFVAALAERPDGASARTVALRVHFYTFMREVHAELRSIEQRTRPLDIVAERLAARARVLCLDEFLVADIADAMLLGGLLRALFERGVTLVTTSNVRPRELYKDGLQRARFLPAIDLLEERLDVLHLDGVIDYRLRRLERCTGYLDSNDPATAAAMAELFAQLTGGTAAGAGSIRIEGRELCAVNRGSGAISFRFDELCAGPRSQYDYIEIARLYRTIFISDVPLFDGTNDDAARRFIMLIDELYDRGVRIVISARAPPAELYRGARLRFEFERAASRLIEMNTQYWHTPHP